MIATSMWPRNRLLLALPARSLKQVIPDLKHIECKREQVLLDADSSLDHVYFPDSGVMSVVAVYPNGSFIEMATIGREGGTGFQAVFGAKSSSARLLVQVPSIALAQEIPEYDSEVHCKRVAESAAKRSAALGRCLWLEEYALDELEDFWPRASKAVREECLEATSGEESYVILARCVMARLRRSR